MVVCRLLVVVQPAARATVATTAAAQLCAAREREGCAPGSGRCGGRLAGAAGFCRAWLGMSRGSARAVTPHYSRARSKIHALRAATHGKKTPRGAGFFGDRGAVV